MTTCVRSSINIYINYFLGRNQALVLTRLAYKHRSSGSAFNIHGCSLVCRVDSRARECENPAYFVILAQNCDLGAPTIPQSTEKWRIFVSFVRVVVLFSTILVVNFRSFPLISVDPVVRDLTETSILLAETVNACAYVFLLSLSLTQDGV